MPGSNRNRAMRVATVAGCFAVAGATFAQTQSATPPPPANPSYSSSPIQMPGSIPSKSETAGSAFEKLSSSQRYITREEAGKLDGFDRAFAEADRDKDDKLNQEEFAVAWAIYTGRT